MNIQSVTDLLIQEMQDLYDAELRLAEALPKLAETAFNEELREALELHTRQTQEHANRLEQAFGHLKIAPKAKPCRAMMGLLDEAEELLKEPEADPAVLDAALIVAAQKVEHYEIAGYGAARTFARLLGARAIARLLQETLDEEAETDRRLTALAESTINEDAAEADRELLEDTRTSGKK